MLNGLLARFHSSQRRDFYRFLATQDRENVAQLPVPEDINISDLVRSDGWMQSIHYSWFVSFLQTISPALLLSSLPQKQAEAIAKTLESPPQKKFVPRFMQLYLTQSLKNQMQKEHILPEQHLLSSPLNELLSLTKPQIMHLIDLLGIHDLAADLRQVVDKALLNKIYAALTQEQLRFLHYCSKQTMPWVPPRLNIAGWDGQKKSLNLLLHKRGLYRLAKALVGEDESLRWHFCHRIDVGRGKILLKLFEEKYDPALAVHFKRQVVHLIRRYQKEI